MRLIDADALKAHYSWWSDDNEYKKIFDDIIDAQPTVDVYRIKEKAKNELEQYYGDVLEDDHTPYGGVDHVGETVAEFIESSGKEFGSLVELNFELVSCGIKPVVRKVVV